MKRKKTPFRSLILICIVLLLVAAPYLSREACAATKETDILQTSDGPLEITFIGHGTLMFRLGEYIIHIDPWTKLADYSSLPKADLILVTHEHRDHLDPLALATLAKPDTRLVTTWVCAQALLKFIDDSKTSNKAAAESVAGLMSNSITMRNNETFRFAGAIEGKNLLLESVPAYNILHMREPGNPFHPRGRGNGYVLTIGEKKIYIGGDTEDIPEMADLKGIHCAFLPMNLPYTMTPEMVARAAGMFKPEILYPYHFGETDTGKLLELMKGIKGVEVRIRSMK